MSNPPFKVKAVYEYTSSHEDDLPFTVGQIITVTEVEDEEWYVGEYIDASGGKQDGIFPRNFVEKYEPTAPPRPSRTRAKKEPDPTSPVASQASPAEPPIESAIEPQQEVEEGPEVVSEPTPISTLQAEAPPTPAEPPPAPVLKSVPAFKPEPPAVSEKPSGGSFRDRIAAFNKAAPPVAPFKPSGLGSGGSSSFIKKPFVAPPPSKNAYVPPVTREPPSQKIYRREEDPEIAAKQAEDLEQAEKAGLAPDQNEEGEEQPKPTSLKERIALLQKQQMEQASRHAEAAQKKEKPKKPVKKKPEAHAQDGAEGEWVAMERQDTEETIGRPSTDSMRDESAVPRRRKSSKGAVTTPGVQPRKSFGDGNEADMSGAGDTTENTEESTGKDSDERPRSRAPTQEPDVGEEEGATEEAEDVDEEEEDIDPELRRKEELRARMAKMSGGMGMHGMFGAMPMPSAPPKKKKSTNERRSETAEETTSLTARAPPVPMVPMPGMSRVKSPEEVEQEDNQTPITTARPPDGMPNVEDVVPQERGAPPPVPFQEPGSSPPIPSGRPAPPPIPKDSRPVPPISTIPVSPRSGSESDDEMSVIAQKASLASPLHEAPKIPSRPSDPIGTPMSPGGKRSSYFASEASPSSPITPGGNKRTSRAPPPVPGTQTRAPPPPPPAGPPSRSQTGDIRAPPEHNEEEGTEYEGDYDTDIASAAPHKDALKSVPRDSDEGSIRSASMPSPTIPSRPAPPPLPSQPPPRQTSEMPRVAPPPPPPGRVPAPWEGDGDDYDPYKYTAPQAPPKAPPRQPAPQMSVPTPKSDVPEDDLYSASPPRSHAMPMQDWGVPKPPQREPVPPPNRAPPRQSLEVSRSATTGGRRSVELGRMSMDSGFVANDIDLAQGSRWWTQPMGVPPAVQNRKDILFESEESTSSKRGRTLVSKDIYVLYQDYSQTIITAQFDVQDPSDVSLEQRHEQPPSRLRQDQLEQAYDQFSARISEAVTSKKETVVGDGTPQGLIHELLKPFPNALDPVGTRGYGALVYANLANASTTQNDEIRPGDIISFRNTKFQGKHGAMHAKYSMEVGKPDHVGVVAEWDGTKKKVRAWEQGRESKKVKMESFKLDDLRSGEVKIWRVMPRSWVGWSGRG